MSTSCTSPVANKHAEFLTVALTDEAYGLPVLSLSDLPRLLAPEIYEPVFAAA